MSEYSLPETLTVLNQTLTYEERGFYFSDSSSASDIKVWVPIPGLWMIHVSDKDGKVFEARGSTFLEAEKNLSDAIGQINQEVSNDKRRTHP